MADFLRPGDHGLVGGGIGPDGKPDARVAKLPPPTPAPAGVVVLNPYQGGGGPQMGVIHPSGIINASLPRWPHDPDNPDGPYTPPDWWDEAREEELRPVAKDKAGKIVQELLDAAERDPMEPEMARAEAAARRAGKFEVADIILKASKGGPLRSAELEPALKVLVAELQMHSSSTTLGYFDEAVAEFKACRYQWAEILEELRWIADNDEDTREAWADAMDATGAPFGESDMRSTRFGKVKPK